MKATLISLVLLLCLSAIQQASPGKLGSQVEVEEAAAKSFLDKRASKTDMQLGILEECFGEGCSWEEVAEIFK
jgi:hypothetical protein